MKTLLLDAVTWDLVADADNNIAVADDPYAPAQDASSAIKLFLGELYYNTSLGINYFNFVLGKTPSLALLKNAFNNAAMRVPGVTAAKSFITAFTNRTLLGQVQITDKTGKVTAIAIRQVIPS
jgi:hypothetical protein